MLLLLLTWGSMVVCRKWIYWRKWTNLAALLTTMWHSWALFSLVKQQGWSAFRPAWRDFNNAWKNRRSSAGRRGQNDCDPSETSLSSFLVSLLPKVATPFGKYYHCSQDASVGKGWLWNSAFERVSGLRVAHPIPATFILFMVFCFVCELLLCAWMEWRDVRRRMSAVVVAWYQLQPTASAGQVAISSDNNLEICSQTCLRI